jgi:hypothetical protein
LLELPEGTVYSVVMTAFKGRHHQFERAVGELDGLRFIDTFSLALSPDKHLPAELCDGKTLPEAEAIAAVLEGAGAAVVVVPTRAVEGVRHRAGEVSSTRSARGWHFTEVNGLICTLAALNARENADYLRRMHPDAEDWRLERSLNHQHPTHDYDREALRVAREMGADLAAALREAYPERRFVLDYLEEQVSFYQQRGNAPEGDTPPAEELPEVVRCERCEERRPYSLRTHPDAEFPKADWGECLACGAELLLRTCEIRVIVPGCAD